MTPDSIRVLVMAVLVSLGIDTMPPESRMVDSLSWADLKVTALPQAWEPDTMTASVFVKYTVPPQPCEFGNVVQAETLSICTVVATLPPCYHICVWEWDANGCKRWREICPLGITFTVSRHRN